MQSIAIDDLKLAEALLAGERRLLEMVATGEPLTDVLHMLSNIAKATGSGVHCSILLIDSDAKFHFGAGTCSLSCSLRSIHFSSASKAGHSACPQSVRLYSTLGGT